MTNTSLYLFFNLWTIRRHWSFMAEDTWGFSALSCSVFIRTLWDPQSWNWFTPSTSSRTQWLAAASTLNFRFRFFRDSDDPPSTERRKKHKESSLKYHRIYKCNQNKTLRSRSMKQNADFQEGISQAQSTATLLPTPKDFPQGASEWPKEKVLDFYLY